MSARPDYHRYRRERLIREFGGRCERPGCRSRDHLEFAHVEHTDILRFGRGRGRNLRTLDVQNNPGAYALLCTDCHDRFDRGEFKVRGFGCHRENRRRAFLTTESAAAEGF